jgi:hypothetical protein
MLVRDRLHLFFLPWVVVCAAACKTDSRTPIVTDALDSTVVAVIEGEVKVGRADKAYVGMTLGEFLKAYERDVLTEQGLAEYGFNGPESMGIYVEKGGEPWIHVIPLTSNFGVEQSPNDTIDFQSSGTLGYMYGGEQSPNDTIAYIIVLSPNIQLHAGFKVGMTVGELVTICPELELWVDEMDGVEYGYCPSVPHYMFHFDAPATGLIGKYRKREDGTTEEHVGIAIPSTTIKYIELSN